MKRVGIQHIIFIGLSLLIAMFTGILHFSGSDSFQRFIGKLHPLLFAILIIGIGAVCLTLLISRQWFSIYQGKLKGIFWGAGLAIPFGLVIMMVDLKVVLPADINIIFPQSLLFYPVMGFAAEILFHVVPLAVILPGLTWLLKQTTNRSIIWISIAAVSLLEPGFQIAHGFSESVVPWATAYIALHIFAINICQLVIFHRFDFVSMYAFRLMYYLIWHIGWGYFRLQWLF